MVRRDLAALPKAHLHVHLESAVRWSTLREIGDANGVPVPAGPGPAGLVFDGFRAFGDHGSAVRGCLRRAEDFARVAREFCADEAAGGARYVEVTFTAASHGERLGDAEMPLEAVLSGLADGGAEHGVEWGVVLDHSRRRSVARFAATVALARRYADAGVVAVGLAGDESFPLAPFAEVIAGTDVPMVHHAGEASGAGSVWDAVGPGRARRWGTVCGRWRIRCWWRGCGMIGCRWRCVRRRTWRWGWCGRGRRIRCRDWWRRVWW